jgi:hypothetical protein
VTIFSDKANAAVWIAALVLTLSAELHAGRPPRISAAPLVPGESLNYLLEYHSTIQSRSASPIYTSDSAHQLVVSVGARIRLDVLGIKSVPKHGRLTRLRVTYETCDATVQGDSSDSRAEALQKQYRDLRGHSFEFAIDGQGRVRDIAGLNHLEPNPSAQSAIRQWLSNITFPLALWKANLKPGKKWSREVPLSSAPLAGLGWRTESTYRDNEPCPAMPSRAAGSPRQTCAVITTRLESVRDGSHVDATPPSYRRQGLKTSGRWIARGESLSYISLSSGLVASSTATETDTIDLTVSSTFSGSRLRYVGREQSNSQIALLDVFLPSVARHGSSHQGSLSQK